MAVRVGTTYVGTVYDVSAAPPPLHSIRLQRHLAPSVRNCSSVGSMISKYKVDRAGIRAVHGIRIQETTL